LHEPNYSINSVNEPDVDLHV